MVYVTHAYGTTRRAKVLERSEHTVKGRRLKVLVLTDEKGEGHVLVGPDGDGRTARVGDEGVLTFTKGGPLGGYWKFTKGPPS